MQQQSSNVIQPPQAYGSYGFGADHPTRIQKIQLGTEDASLPLKAMIITLVSGSSYDSLFRKKPQVVEGGRVAVWAVPLSTSSIAGLLRLVKEEDVPEEFAGIKRDLAHLAPENVVFNFECCSACSENGFDSFSADVVHFIAMAARHCGFVVMCSDFSLKAILAKWDESHLGPNPFVQVGTMGTGFRLEFDSNSLKECRSPQLVAVGRMVEDGGANVHAMGGTIVFAERIDVDLSAAPFTVDILTVQTKLDGKHPSVMYGNSMEGKRAKMSTIGDATGTVGHATLTFAGSNGLLICSSGHWVELSQLDTSEDNVFRAVEMQFGAAVAEQQRSEYSAMPAHKKQQALQSYGSSVVQQAAPCNYAPMFPTSKKG